MFGSFGERGPGRGYIQDGVYQNTAIIMIFDAIISNAIHMKQFAPSDVCLFVLNLFILLV
jgi:hypothetical protein